jgi:hypothetical protein
MTATGSSRAHGGLEGHAKPKQQEAQGLLTDCKSVAKSIWDNGVKISPHRFLGGVLGAHEERGETTGVSNVFLMRPSSRTGECAWDA